MIENIGEKKEEVKEIWLKNREGLKLGQFYKKFLGDYFNVEGNIKGTTDWLFFLRWYKDWRKVEKKIEKEKELEERLEEVTDESVEEIQSQNRNRMIVILSGLLADYENLDDTSPLRKALSLAEIRRWYGSIQSLEEKMKMTAIARGKLKLDAVKTLLPYKRMNPEELLALKGKLNESFDRIIKLKSGSPVGRPSPDRG